MMMTPTRTKVVLEKTAKDVPFRLQRQGIGKHEIDDKVIPVLPEWTHQIVLNALFLTPVLFDMRIRFESIENLKGFLPETAEREVDLFRNEQCFG